MPGLLEAARKIDISDIPDDITGIARRVDISDLPDDPTMPDYRAPEPLDYEDMMMKMIEEKPDLADKDFEEFMARTLYPFVKPFQAVGVSAAEALNRGTGLFATHLDLISGYIEEKTGFPVAGDMFEKFAEKYYENAEYWQERAKKIGPSFLEELFGEALGGAVPGVGEFLLNIPYYGALGAAEARKEGRNELAGALMGATERGLLGAVFHTFGPLKRYLKAPAMGSIFGLQAVKEGGGPKEVAKSFGTGMLYGSATPGGRMGLNDVYRSLKTESVKAEATYKKHKERFDKEEKEETEETGIKRGRTFYKLVGYEKDKPIYVEMTELLQDGIRIGFVEGKKAKTIKETKGEEAKETEKKAAEEEGKKPPPGEGIKEKKEVKLPDFPDLPKQPWDMQYRDFVELYEEQCSGNGEVFGSKIGNAMGIESKAGAPLYRIDGKAFGENATLPRERWRIAVLRKAAELDIPVKREIVEEYKGQDWADRYLERFGPAAEPEIDTRGIKPLRSLKDQKAYLLGEIDKAIAKTKGEAETKVRVQIPGDGEFIIPDTKNALENFKKKAKALYPTVEKPKPPKGPAKPSLRPTGKRITGDIIYYNEFQPQKEDVLVRKNAENFYIDNSYHSDGAYMIRAPKVKEVEYKEAKLPEWVIPEKLEEAYIIGEFYAGVVREAPVTVHIVSVSGRDRVIKAEYADSILTKYPDATVQIGGGMASPVVFYDKGEVVGVVMPLKDWRMTDADFVLERAREVISEKLDLPEDAYRDMLKTEYEKKAAEVEEKAPEPAAGEGAAEEAFFQPEEGFRRKPEPGKEEEAEPARRSDIVKLLKEKLDIPIRTGRFRDKALGIFKIKTEVIRTKKANDIEVIAHETGHALQKFLYPEAVTKKGLSSKPFEPFRAELGPIATQQKAGQSALPEGFAEFVRLYVTNESRARGAAPKFYDHFERLLDEKSPEAKEILLDARKQYDRWIKQPALQRVLSQVSIGRDDKRPVTFTDLYTAIVDDLYPLRKAVKEMTKGEELPTAKDPYSLARLMRGWHGKPAAFLRKSPIKFKTYEEVGKPLQEILSPLENRLDEFRAYIVSRRAIELDNRKIETGIIRADAEKIVADYEKDFARIFEDLKEYQEHVLNYLKDSGVGDKKMYEAIKAANEDYVPFYRVMEEGRKSPGTGRGLQSRQPVKKIKGSWRDIQDPLESIVKNTYLYINLAEKNAIGRALTKLAREKEGLGKWVEKIPAPLQKITVKEAELLGILTRYGKWTQTTQYREAERVLKEKITELGKEPGEAKTPVEKVEATAREALTTRGFSEAEADQMLNRLKGAKSAGARTKIIEKTIQKTAVRETVKEFELDLPKDIVDLFRPSGFMPTDNVMSVWENGKRTLYEVHEDIARSFKALDQENANMLVQILSVPAKWLRIGATTTPDFIVRNLQRDTLSAFTYSKYGFLPVIDTVKGVFHIAKRDEMYWDWRKGGGEHSMLVSLDRKYLQENIGDLIQKYPLQRIIRHPFEGVRMLSELAESGSRIGEYARGQKAELGKGATKKEAMQAAAMASREVTLDFAKKGSATKAANMLIAFFQAQINGTDKMIRAFKDNPVRTSMRVAAAITLPSILLTISNRDDPRWKDVPQWQKDLFWIVFTENHIFRIPKPFELGIIFGTVPERITEYILNKDPHAFDHLLDAIWRGAAPGIVPTAGLPWVENWANQSLFLDRPIVPQSMEDVLPEYQYKPYTTETAKALGKILGKLPVIPDIVSPSPAKIENLVRGWTGGVGTYALQLSDWFLKKAGITKKTYEEPTKTLADIPFVRAFVVRYPTANAEGIQDFYENYEKAGKIRNTAQMLISRENDYDTALGLLQEGQVERLDSFHQALRSINKMINQIYIDPVMTGDEKREFIDMLYMQMCGIARDGNKIFKELDEAVKDAEKGGS